MNIPALKNSNSKRMTQFRGELTEGCTFVLGCVLCYSDCVRDVQKIAQHVFS